MQLGSHHSSCCFLDGHHLYQAQILFLGNMGYHQANQRIFLIIYSETMNAQLNDIPALLTKYQVEESQKDNEQLQKKHASWAVCGHYNECEL
jgi:hypothetical protein